MTRKVLPRIRELRKKAGLSQRQLAALLNLHHSSISKWETGEYLPSVPVLLQISQILKCDLYQILGDDFFRDY